MFTYPPAKCSKSSDVNDESSLASLRAGRALDGACAVKSGEEAVEERPLPVLPDPPDFFELDTIEDFDIDRPLCKCN